MTYPRSETILIQPQILFEALEHTHVLDCRWYLPNDGRDGHGAYGQGHIPGARFFDLDANADPGAPWPHMLPDGRAMARLCGALGIAPEESVVCYEDRGLFAAPRVRWMLRRFGFHQCRLLDGGFDAWQAAGLPVEHTMPNWSPKDVPPLTLESRHVATLDDVRAALEHEETLVVDARSPGRFEGREAEPRPEVRPGHMPGAVNLPFGEVCDPVTGRLHDVDTLRALMDRALGSDWPHKTTIATCGSGVTACVLALAQERILGEERTRIYDGSWSEWGGRDDTPVVP